MTSPPLFLRVTEYRTYAFRAVWKTAIPNTFLTPAVFLVAMGLGIGSYVEDTSTLGGVEYIVFLAPGLMAATVMNVAVAEATFPVFSSVHWDKIAYSQVATPLSPADIAIGQIFWAACRLLMSAVIFMLMMLLFDTVKSPWAILAVPAAILVGLAFVTPLVAWAIGLDRMNSFPSLQRFVIVPMFLFSGTFFPVSQLPDLIEPLAYVTPLWHGVRLCRSLTLGVDVLSLANLGHVLVLTSMVVVGVVYSVRSYNKKLLV